MNIRFLIPLLFLAPALNAQTRPPAKISLSNPVAITKPARKIQWPGSNIATSGLGFFCRQELKLDKQTAVPVRFRLGGMQQTDWLESKPNAQKPQP